MERVGCAWWVRIWHGNDVCWGRHGLVRIVVVPGDGSRRSEATAVRGGERKRSEPLPDDKA